MITKHRPGTMQARIVELIHERPRSTNEIAEALGIPLKKASNAIGVLSSGEWIEAMPEKAPRVIQRGPNLSVWRIAKGILE